MIPPFDDEKDRMDHFWRATFKTVAEMLEEKLKELMKLIKICCSLSYGQDGVERGFSDTKRIVSDRVPLNDESVKGLKTVREVIRNVGGAENVPISHILINSVKHA